MKLAPVAVLLALSALAVTGCDEVDDAAGVGAQKGVYTGAQDAPLSEEARRALTKRATRQNFGL